MFKAAHHDAASRLTTVTDWDSNVTSYSYDDAGRMTLVELPNGVETSYTYDDGDRLTDIEHLLGLTTLAFVNYTLDDVGNRTQRVDGQGTHVYAYDDVYRLTSVTYPGPSTTSYVYDAFGNRTSMTVGANTTTYAYDDNDRITSVTPPSASPIAYTWDDNGNLEDRGSDGFVWDYEDRLVETTVNSVTTEFSYRGDGLRDSRTVGMNTTTFTWDIAAGIPVVLDDGNRYIYGAHGLIAQVEGTDWYYFLSDGLGSTMAITDDLGTVVRDYTYDAFGEVTGGSGTVDSEFQFAGEQVDGSTGLQYLRARYYDMESGTFLSKDPLAFLVASHANSYTYALGSPQNLSDPSGLIAEGGPACTVLQWCSIPFIPGISILDPLDAGFDGIVVYEAMKMPFGLATQYRGCLISPDGIKSCSPGSTATRWLSMRGEILVAAGTLIGEYIGSGLRRTRIGSHAGQQAAAHGLTKAQLHKAVNQGREIKYMRDGVCVTGYWDRVQRIFVAGVKNGEATTVWANATSANITNQVLSKPCP